VQERAWGEEAVIPGERELTVVNAHADKRSRSQAALMILSAVALALMVVRQPALLGVPGPVWAAGLITGGFLLAWQRGVLRRAHAMLRLSTIRKEGLEATAKLGAGDLSGAKEAFTQLLFSARPLGAFHAVHVLMYGVTRYFEGATKEGLVLANRALDSQWLNLRHTREVKNAAEAWRVLMLLDAGELKEARRRATEGNVLATAALAVSAYEEKWEDVVAGAKAALGDAGFPKSGRPTVALLGRYAAKKQGVSARPFEKVLEEDKPGALVLQNPALKRFL
jgi:hypothetical protein